jgi:hypothetical protein
MSSLSFTDDREPRSHTNLEEKVEAEGALDIAHFLEEARAQVCVVGGAGIEEGLCERVRHTLEACP